MTWFMFRRCKVQWTTFYILTTAILLLAIFMERFCFIVIVYKSKYYGYVLILLVISMNCVFNFILAQIKPKKAEKKLHKIFKLDRTPELGCFVVTIIGALDMLYAFFLFLASQHFTFLPAYKSIADFYTSQPHDEKSCNWIKVAQKTHPGSILNLFGSGH